MTFNEWWKQMKPAECDELKPYFEEAWELSAATERDACAELCERMKSEAWRDAIVTKAHNTAASNCAAAIRARSNV